MEQYDHNDEELLRRVVRGDSKAFNKLYDRHFAAVSNVGMKYLQDKALTEDLVQEVFGKFWKSRESFHQVENFKAYFFTIVRHAAVQKIKELAKEQSQREKYGQHLDRSENNVETHLLNFDEHRTLRLLIGKLPVPHQRVFNLIKMEGLDRTAVAERLELKQQTVDNYLVLAMKELRRHMRHILAPPYWIALAVYLLDAA